MRGPKFTLGALRPPAHLLAEKCSYLKSSVIFVNENENENDEKRENNEFVNEN